MSQVLDILSWIFLLGGSLCCLLGGIGLLRFPDVYSRTHATSMTDTLGSTLILLGLALQVSLGAVTVRLLILLVLIYITGPTATHALAKAAYARGVTPILHEDDT
jgi:multicomponent Na+:H+ antiporter subunit G